MGMSYRAITAVLAAGVLAACAPSTVVELKRSSKPETFVVNTNYQLAFKNLKNELTRCVTDGFLMAKTGVDAQLYPDLGMGEIAVRNNNMGDISVFFQAELRKTPEGTRVSAYAADTHNWKSYTAKVTGFLKTGEPVCEE